MKNLISFLFSILFLFTNSDLSAQDSLTQKSIVPEGITVEYGIGSYAVTDEYISAEKYSGSLPYYSITWANQHSDYVYR
jgi:hypothetical protein